MNTFAAVGILGVIGYLLGWIPKTLKFVIKLLFWFGKLPFKLIKWFVKVLKKDDYNY